ncbi:GntR family transcriptional regulator [Streptacidiphilus jiangxiensis]|uniref:DNA-binding transcriptional regulator, GntR family n=1 Tax=Streptacidiphilus jiangxiensis TaxID=235985 RepID=A0A1H7JUX0_STRJI|nr:GntR family transcriptional regulator [Streptacidiphilus jiangxiensis]SEK78164.1 DNA-binding transcriptional regulator, GntR family [Streptacidiphilus jiangxiensis]
MPSGTTVSSADRRLGGPPVVHRSSLREQVAAALRDELMAGRLAAGRHFTVKEIAELYGVSATPVREALVDLAAQGMLVVEPGRGFAVPRFTWDDFVDIVEARSLVIDGIFRRLRGRLSALDPDAVASLRRRADAAVRAARAGQLDLLVGCDRRFWAELGAFAGNRRIGDYLDWLRVQYWIFAASYLRARDDVASFCWSRHLELVELIEAGDQAGVHAMLLAYNQESLEQMSALCGRPLPDDVPLQVPAPREAPSLPATTQ